MSLKTCPRCQAAHDFSKSWCEPCTKAYRVAYREANKERLTAARKKHYQDNKPAYHEQAKAWKSDNPEGAALHRSRYYGVHKERENERLRQWEAANLARRQAAKKAWRQANKPVLAAQCRTRQAMKLNATPPWANLDAIKVEYALAAWCSQVMGAPYHVDHAIPLQGALVCGLHVEANLQVIPAKVNLAKGNRCA